MIKPGRKTTEWWLILAVITGNVIAAAAGALDSQNAQRIDWRIVVAAAAYALSRGLAKLGGAGGGGGGS